MYPCRFHVILFFTTHKPLWSRPLPVLPHPHTSPSMPALRLPYVVSWIRRAPRPPRTLCSIFSVSVKNNFNRKSTWPNKWQLMWHRCLVSQKRRQASGLAFLTPLAFPNYELTTTMATPSITSSYNCFWRQEAGSNPGLGNTYSSLHHYCSESMVFMVWVHRGIPNSSLLLTGCFQYCAIRHSSLMDNLLHTLSTLSAYFFSRINS